MKIKYLWLFIVFLILILAAVTAAQSRGDSGRSPSLTDQYDAYNFMYFKASLPRVNISMSDGDSKDMGVTVPCGKGCFQIIIFKKWNPAPKTESLTLLHEMCHVATPPEIEMHGPKFQACMHRLADAGAFEPIW